MRQRGKTDAKEQKRGKGIDQRVSREGIEHRGIAETDFFPFYRECREFADRLVGGDERLITELSHRSY